MDKNETSIIDDPFGIPYERLPKTLAVFPLPEVMLLPHGKLPLNIFEPRYLKMILDNLEKPRLIGMVQPLEPLSQKPKTEASLFHIGCAGRITTFAESNDGRLVITLQGVCRFKIQRELDGNDPYRTVIPDFSNFKDDLSFDDPNIDRKGLMPILKSYLELKGIGLNAEDLNKIQNRHLIPTLGMINPFDYREKRAILETRNINDIADMIISLMEMELKSPNQTTTKH